jgi:hypothetical protein
MAETHFSLRGSPDEGTEDYRSSRVELARQWRSAEYPLSVDLRETPARCVKNAIPWQVAVLGILFAATIGLEIYITIVGAPAPAVALCAPLVIWLGTFLTTGSSNPFIIAVGHDNGLSLSIWQHRCG